MHVFQGDVILPVLLKIARQESRWDVGEKCLEAALNQPTITVSHSESAILSAKFFIDKSKILVKGRERKREKERKCLSVMINSAIATLVLIYIITNTY